MYIRKLLLLQLVFVSGCDHSISGQDHQTEHMQGLPVINKSGKTIAERFRTPGGYARKPGDANSFGKYLRDLPLKPDGAAVLYYNGSAKSNNNIYSAVVDMEIGKQNLQQCADAVMRLRAEYLYKTGQANKIHFNFTNGFRVDYSRWRNGERLAVQGNNVKWVTSTVADSSYSTFRQYLDMVFSYAGTLSLSRELQSVAYTDLQIGDVLIQGGSPGHAVIVVDMAEDETGKKAYLLAQSYMPAQEIQILHNPKNSNISPWYELDPADEVIQTPEWKFTSNDLKRFRKE